MERHGLQSAIDQTYRESLETERLLVSTESRIDRLRHFVEQAHSVLVRLQTADREHASVSTRGNPESMQTATRELALARVANQRMEETNRVLRMGVRQAEQQALELKNKALRKKAHIEWIQDRCERIERDILRFQRDHASFSSSPSASFNVAPKMSHPVASK
eukprot:ANDGO_01762.mRNA.1 hypothetical protein